MPSCHCLVVAFCLNETNDVKQEIWGREVSKYILYITAVTLQSTVQLVHINTVNVRKNSQFLNCDEQFLKKNRKQGSFKTLVRKKGA
jgi:hypothetical protein